MFSKLRSIQKQPTIINNNDNDIVKEQQVKELLKKVSDIFKDMRSKDKP
jgi:hypothetical protein